MSFRLNEDIPVEHRSMVQQRIWREWGVPEHVIVRALAQRAYVSGLRAKEEFIKINSFSYLMPKLPMVEREAWGVAKSIDFEGTIEPKDTFRTDRADETYRYTYQRPRITIETRTYDLMEEIANMMHLSVLVLHVWDGRLGRRVVAYRVQVTGARAVRAAYLIEPHLKHPEKRTRARLILETYRARPETRA